MVGKWLANGKCNVLCLSYVIFHHIFSSDYVILCHDLSFRLETLVKWLLVKRYTCEKITFEMVTCNMVPSIIRNV